MKNRLIAHRGDMTDNVENTLSAIQSAIDLNMHWIEVDVQLSSDRIPVVVHDHSLARIAGVRIDVTNVTAEELAEVPLLERKSSSAIYRIPTLEQLVIWLKAYPGVTLFVEIKRESVNEFGLMPVVDAVMSVLQHAQSSVVVISFLFELVAAVKSQFDVPVGWVLTDFNERTYRQCTELRPEFVFCNVNKVNSADDLWDGSWRWALYDVRDPKEARRWLSHERIMIETGDIARLMNSPLLD